MRWLRRAIAVPAFARKNETSMHSNVLSEYEPQLTASQSSRDAARAYIS